VTNNGPDDTVAVTASVTVPTSILTINTVLASQGTCAISGDGTTITCDIGDLVNAASVEVTINVTAADSAGAGSATFNVTSANADSNTANNSGSVEITVGAPTPPGECQDGVDNDNDGFIDGDDPGCDDGTEAPDNSPPPPPPGECEDGVDNDNDGLVDGDDPGCDDGTEAPDNSPPPPPPPPPPPSSSGGGSVGLPFLLGLIAIVAIRRQRYRR
jgi:hypothetical protein